MSNLSPDITQVFEFTDESEWDTLLKWANALDGGGSKIPPALKVGDILVRRPDGAYEIFRRYDPDAATTSADNAVARESIRLEILRIAATSPRYVGEKKSTLGIAKEFESWVFRHETSN